MTRLALAMPQRHTNPNMMIMLPDTFSAMPTFRFACYRAAQCSTRLFILQTGGNKREASGAISSFSSRMRSSEDYGRCLSCTPSFAARVPAGAVPLSRSGLTSLPGSTTGRRGSGGSCGSQAPPVQRAGASGAAALPARSYQALGRERECGGCVCVRHPRI